MLTRYRSQFSSLSSSGSAGTVLSWDKRSQGLLQLRALADDSAGKGDDGNETFTSKIIRRCAGALRLFVLPPTEWSRLYLSAWSSMIAPDM